jgi:hypothetical protein
MPSHDSPRLLLLVTCALCALATRSSGALSAHSSSPHGVHTGGPLGPQDVPTVQDAVDSGIIEPVLQTRSLGLETVYASTGELVVRVPLNIPTVIAIVMILALAVAGVVFIYRLATQHVCACPLCTKQYEIIKRLGTGGFGSVYEVRRRNEPGRVHPRGGGGGGGDATARKKRRGSVAAAEGAGGGGSSDSGGDAAGGGGVPGPHASATASDRFVLKMIPCPDYNAASEAQREAKDLRFLRHPAIVSYVDDFLHAPPAVSASSAAALLLPAHKGDPHADATAAAGSGGLHVCIVMEWCAMDLHRYLLVSRLLLLLLLLLLGCL